MADDRDRQARLAQLGAALQDAAARADWDRLGEHVRTLVPVLHALAAQGPWSVAERGALQRLHAVHDAAAGSAAAAARTLEARLAEIRANKDGWIAYAMYSETEFGTRHE